MLRVILRINLMKKMMSNSLKMKFKSNINILNLIIKIKIILFRKLFNSLNKILNSKNKFKKK